jgi:subtilisin family serine protease
VRLRRARKLDTFRAAGWSFIARPDVRPAFVERGPRGAEPGRAIYVHEGDRAIAVGTGALVVGLQDACTAADVQALFERRHLRVIRRLSFAPHLYVVTPVDAEHPFDVAWALTNDETGWVRYAEPDFIERIGARSTDPDFAKQWQWSNDAGADVSAEGAWSETRGAGVVVAVIDAGFHLGTHDLAAVDSGGAFRENGQGDAIFEVTDALPPSGHGTFCASLVTGARHNGSAGCGIAPEAGLLPIACLRDQVGSQQTLARAIAYAADPGREGHPGLTPASIISCSLGPDTGVFRMRSVLRDALVFARSEGRGTLGVPVFWAIANEQAAIANDEVNSSGLTVPVGSTDDQDVRDACAFGPELAFVAPGVRVVGLLPDDTTGPQTGTSFAAPIAAGIAALVLSINPALTASQVVDVLKASCDPGATPPGPTGRNDEYGHGRLNAARAVQLAKASLT